MVDVVITYVDSRDKSWVDSYNKFVKNPLENVENRFRSYDCLDLQIKLIRKNMSFVNKIFVVVSSMSQVPENIKNLNNVYIVTHSQIIPKRYLPCFNSCTIEMFLYNIKELGEYFIYFNDDMFVVNKCKETDFFKDGKIVIDFEEKEYDVDFASPFENNIINSTRLINKEATKFIKPHHFCIPAIKSHMIDIISKNINEISKSLTRTRHRININFYTFIDYEILTNNYIKKHINSKYFSGCEDDKFIYLESKKAKLICINDNYVFDYQFFCQNIRKIFECLLNNQPYIDESLIINTEDYFPQYKKVVYTCLTGNYDDLVDPGFISPYFDYICFSDNPNLKSKVWKILPIPEDLLYLSNVKQQRNIKINTHKYLPQYDLSIWVDTSVRLNANINNIIQTLNFEDYNIFITDHKQRNCIYEEGKACIELKKDTENNINFELNVFKQQGMPINYGLLETNVIIKLHNDKDCIQLMEEWAKYINLYSHRDQISLPYCLWKLNYTKLYKLPIGFNHTEYFNWIGGLHKKINICIIHYNTPELTNALVKSINKYVRHAIIYMFDNSTTKPFNYKYENLIYLDNTNSQYIDFDRWLENYPNRFMSKESIGNCGSARHSISVQKCMEIINENFILMDSDILLKRNINGFVNNKYIYVGQSEQQPNGKYRVLPFCLFINVKMCKEKGVDWFDENYMHGLYVSKESDRYDTGGAFYIKTRNLPYKEVNLDSFIVHYKGGSWEDKYNKRVNRTLTSFEWLEINKKYWE